MTLAAPTERPLPQHVLARLAAQPWAIEPTALRVLARIASRESLDGLDVTAIEKVSAAPLAGTEAGEVRDGVALFKIVGPLFRYADFFTQICGATSYESLSTDFSAALESPEIEAIVFDINSPGGEADGCAELCEMIYAARGRKPILAYISGVGCSAAYWIASACDEVVASETAIVGSIGVRMVFTDDSVAREARGLRDIEIVSSQTPRKADSPTTDTGRASMQATADALAAVFLAKVARNRGVDPAAVATQFGAGGVFVGAQAVEAGLVDDVGTLEGVLAAMVAPVASASHVRTPTMSLFGRSKAGAPKAAAYAEQAQVVSQVARTVTIDQGAAGTVTKVIEGATVYGVDFGAGEYLWMSEDELAAVGSADAPATDPAPAARSHTVAQIRAESVTAGATAERERIRGILALSGPGREKLIEAAIAEPGCTIEQAGLRIAQLQQNPKHLAALAADDAPSQAPAAVLEPGATDPSSVTAIAQRILTAGMKAPAGR